MKRCARCERHIFTGALPNSVHDTTVSNNLFGAIESVASGKSKEIVVSKSDSSYKLNWESFFFEDNKDSFKSFHQHGWDLEAKTVHPNGYGGQIILKSVDNRLKKVCLKIAMVDDRCHEIPGGGAFEISVHTADTYEEYDEWG
jgi:hypothetical protein